MELLLELLWILFPFLLVMLLLYVIVARKKVVWKIVIFVTSFVIIETMLLYKQLWWLHGEHRRLEIEFTSDGWILFTLSLVGLLIVVGCILFQVKLNRYVIWTGKNIFKSVTCGSIGAIILSLPIILLNFYSLGRVPVDGSLSLFISIIMFIVVGKSIEELLFRGYLQGYLDRIYSPFKSGFITTAIYSLLNFLILIVANEYFLLAWIQTIYIGIICSCLRYRYGILASTLANALAIICWYLLI
ncbi:CPBP family glutamic-type intramembrane protease [Paenibacillus endoradicis]|uniref:CPBP family glutamic-type intramembrane protease n=1 Tax=Paenibacillus endoradicis TaxID=2972487 RepID=UPI002158EB0C|nr:CPBP family glutamic-type intramembrane protease [Paenibacillus endoradicis]MCR8659053.1 CPBP family glutamic-type intramembrane protease [Paenibacillus endoradicis]